MMPTQVFDQMVLKQAVKMVIDDLYSMQRVVNGQAACVEPRSSDDVYGAKGYSITLKARVSELDSLLERESLWDGMIPEWAQKAVDEKVTRIIEGIVATGLPMPRKPFVDAFAAGITASIR